MCRRHDWVGSSQTWWQMFTMFSPVVVCCPACWRGWPPSGAGQRPSTGTARWSRGPRGPGWGPGASGPRAHASRPALGSTPGGTRRRRYRTGAWAGPAPGESIRLNGPVNKSICDSLRRTLCQFVMFQFIVLKLEIGGNPAYTRIIIRKSKTRTFLPNNWCFVLD